MDQLYFRIGNVPAWLPGETGERTELHVSRDKGAAMALKSRSVSIPANSPERDQKIAEWRAEMRDMRAIEV